MLEALVGQSNPLTGFDEMIQAQAGDTFDKTPQSKTPKVEAGPRGTKATIDGPNSGIKALRYSRSVHSIASVTWL